MRRWAALLLALAACEQQPPAPLPQPPPQPPPAQEPPEPVQLQPAVAPDTVPNDPGELVMLFVRLWDEHLADYAPASPRFLRATADRVYALRRRFLTPELLAPELVKLDLMREKLKDPERPEYEMVSVTPEGDDGAVVVYRRSIGDGKRTEERAIDAVRRDGRWWIESVHVGGVGTVPMQVVEVGKLHVVPADHRWVDDASTPPRAANAYAELFMRVRVDQTNLYLEGIESFVSVCRRFLVPERLIEIEQAMAAAKEAGIGRAAALVRQVGPVEVADETHAHFKMAVPVDASRSTMERIDLVKIGEEWRVSRVAVPHGWCGGTGVCRACEGTGVYNEQTCPDCIGSRRCEKQGCDGTGYVPSNR